MKRSEINDIIHHSDAFIRSFGYVLPPFAYLSSAEMIAQKDTLSALIDAGLGWDITDFGQGKFDELGLFLFTVRNGRADDLARGQGMLYAEKIMIARRNQITPMHRHLVKAEDIINRGGGDLVIELFMSDAELNPDQEKPVLVPCDGIERQLNAGDKLVLKPGESVTLLPGVWHAFWAEKADTLIGEVSTVNNDLTDNFFLEPVGRFSDIVEDCEPDRLLVADYSKWL